MTPKVVEVLAKILDGLNKKYSLEDVSKNLTSENKFDKQTVSAAFSLVYDKIVENRSDKIDDPKEQNKNIRILSEEELEVISIEHYNYLIYLQNIGLIEFAVYKVSIQSPVYRVSDGEPGELVK